MKNKTINKNNWFLCVFCLYIGIVLIRYLFTLITTSFPTVSIDEFLYFSLSRSIATEGRLLFRGQSADYAYILYPLILSPIYMIFQDGADFYRLLQLWNTILISSSVFPLYFLCREIFQSGKKAFTISALAMLLPDFILGELIFSEAIIYPLFFTLIYCVYIYINRKDRQLVLWIGLIGGLMYSTKPGSMVPAAVFIILMMIHAIVKRNGKDLLYAVASVLILAATVIFFFALAKYAFGYEGSFLSIYETQINGSGGYNIGLFVKALVLYPFYFILSCGMVGFVYPAVSVNKWDPKIRNFWWFVIISLFIMMIGSAWIIEQKSDIHLRYIAMYIPLMLLFCSIPQKEEIKKTTSDRRPADIKLFVILGYIIFCTVIFGCKAKFRLTYAHPSMSLSVLNERFFPFSRQLFGNIIIVLVCVAVFFLFNRESSGKRNERFCIVFMSLFMFINSIFGYICMHDDAYYPVLANNGKEAHRLTEQKPYVYLLAYESVSDKGVDVNSKDNNCIIYTLDFFNNIRNGIYRPFIPAKMRGMRSVKETPDIDTLIVDYASIPLIKFSENASVLSPFDLNSILVVKFTPGDRIIDSMLGNLSGRTLIQNTPGIIRLFKEDYLNKPITISLEIECAKEQKLTVNSTHEKYTLDLAPGKQWYDIRFDKAEKAYNFQVEDEHINVWAYKLIGSDE